MIVGLKLLFGFFLLSMIGVTIIASLQANMFAALPGLLDNPWAVATLWDAYLGFFTFFVWVSYKETSVGLRVLWFVLIMGLGNIAMSSYVLVQLWRLPADAGIESLLLRRTENQANG